MKKFKKVFLTETFFSFFSFDLVQEVTCKISMMLAQCICISFLFFFSKHILKEQRISSFVAASGPSNLQLGMSQVDGVIKDLRKK